MTSTRGSHLLLLLLVTSGCAGSARSEAPAQAAQPIATPPAGEAELPEYVAVDTEPKLTNGDEMQKLLSEQYPADLREAGISGSIDLFMFIDASGTVTEVRPFGPRQQIQFEQAAERIARSMKFRPAEYGGRPIGVWIIQKIEFTTR